MSQNKCCVPGCQVTTKDGVTLHHFPNPETSTEKFKNWISNIGGDITELDADVIFRNRRVCSRHFERIYKYPTNRLSRIAVPSLHLTSVHQPLQYETEAINVAVAIATPVVHSDNPSNVFPTSSSLLNSGYSQDNAVGHDSKKEKKYSRKRKAPHLSLKQHKEYKLLLKQLEKSKTEKDNFRKKYLLARKMKKTQAFQIITKHMSKSAKIFCHMQASQSGKRKRGRRFSLDEKILALSLYKPSPKAYRLLSNICILPSRRSLQNLLHKVNMKPGINTFIFDHIKERVNKMPENYKYCNLIFDEMAIGPGVTYDKKNDKIIGLVDNGDHSENQYCDHVLVFMIRGILKKYKQPLAYYFCSGSTKATELKAHIKDVINNIQQTGLTVVATICDQGASNLSAINSLLNDTKEHYLKNNCEYREGFFEIGDSKIFPIYDPPHLIKGVRNNLLTKNLTFNLKGKACTAKWDHIIALFKRCPGYSGVKLVPKLSAHHVLPELIPKMRVKHCTQVFSKSVGVALGCMAELGALEKESTETADLLIFFDDLFDSVNGSFSTVRNGKVYRSAVTATSPHHKLWNYSIPILKSMKFVNANNKGVVPSLSSWIKTIENFKRIVKYLHSKGVNSLLLRHFNQDPIENFFGAIRAHGYSNIMPTATAFEGAYKTLMVNNITSSHSVGSNCEKDDNVCLQSLKYFIINHGDNNSPTECEHQIENIHLNMEILDTEVLLKSKSPMDLEKCAAIGYCSGWIAQLAKKNIYKSCAVCKSDLESEEQHSFHQYIKAKEYGSKKWLCYPTRPLFDFFAQVENICIEILKTEAKRKNISSYVKLILTINLNVAFLSCDTHKEILGQYLYNKSTIFFLNNWCKEVNNVLTGKSPFWDVTDEMKNKAHRHYSKNKGRPRRGQ